MNLHSRFAPAVLTLSLLLPVASAGEIVEQGELTIYAFENVSYDGEDVLGVGCSDIGVDNDFLNKGDVDGHKEYMQGIEQQFGTDIVFACQAYSESGTPFFSPGEFAYVIDGIQYTLEYDDYLVNGSTGQLREGASSQVVVAFTNARRGGSIKLFYGNDSVEFFIKYLP